MKAKTVLLALATLFMSAFFVFATIAIINSSCTFSWLAFGSFMISVSVLFAGSVKIFSMLKNMQTLADNVIPGLILTFWSVLILGGYMFSFQNPSFEFCPNNLTIFTHTSITEYEQLIIGSRIYYSLGVFLLSIPVALFISEVIKKFVKVR